MDGLDIHGTWSSVLVFAFRVLKYMLSGILFHINFYSLSILERDLFLTSEDLDSLPRIIQHSDFLQVVRTEDFFLVNHVNNYLRASTGNEAISVRDFPSQYIEPEMIDLTGEADELFEELDGVIVID
jgi:hypothetical protein